VGGLFLQHVEHDAWGKVELVEAEFIGMHDFDAERPEDVGG
jgi:hypothetical protein